MDSVVPLAMGLLAGNENVIHLRVGGRDAGWVLARIKLRLDREARRGADAPNEPDHSLAVDQWSATPVLCDVAEQPVLDLVALYRA